MHRLPLSANGKLDRAALPTPDVTPDADRATVEPATDAERAVAAIWCEVLKLDRVGADEDFFALGGHSLLAAQAVLQLSELLGREIALHTLFANPTPATLARAVDAAAVELEPIPLLDRASAQREPAGSAR